MKTFKKKNLLLLLFLLCIAFYLFADVDPFYTKVFKEGQDYFAAGNFQEAIVNFEIAEFGLFEDHEVLKDIYLYYALAQFQLGRLNESAEVIKKLQTELKIADLTAVTPPQPIKNPVTAMLAVLAKTHTADENNSWRRTYNFELLFLETLQYLKNNAPDKVEDNIRKLENINKKEPRLNYIKGILKFMQQDYQSSVKALKTFEKVKPLPVKPSLLDNLYYHLSLAYHYLNNEKQTAVYYNKVKNLKIKSELYEKIAKNEKQGEKNH